MASVFVFILCCSIHFFFDWWMRGFVVLGLVFFHIKPRDWLGETSPKWPISCRAGRKTTTQSINLNVHCVHNISDVLSAVLGLRDRYQGNSNLATASSSTSLPTLSVMHAHFQHQQPHVIYLSGIYQFLVRGWLGSRVVSVLDSGAEMPGFKSQLRRCFSQKLSCVALWQFRQFWKCGEIIHRHCHSGILRFDWLLYKRGSRPTYV